MRTKILFEDQDILVCHKPANLAVETRDTIQMDMVSECKNYLRERSGKQGVPYLAVIHRLDQPVEGVIVFGKKKEAAARLSEALRNGAMEKIYLAAVYGTPSSQTGKLVDYLCKQESGNRSFVASRETKDAKEARLSYEILGQKEEAGITWNVVKIKLDTGRHHQIRVQFSHAGMPLLGDQKYGNEASIEASEELFIANVQLLAYELSFPHPTTGERMTFRIPKIPNLMRLS